MKKTNKIIAVILAVILSFSSVPLIASASAVDDKVQTVEDLIQPSNLGSLVSWLLKSINTRKGIITGTVLRLAFMLIEDEGLKTAIGNTNVVEATDSALADILVKYLDTNLPTWTKSITEQSWWSTVTSVAGLIGINVDISNTRSAVITISKACAILHNSFLFNFGDLENLSDTAIKNINSSSSSIDIIKAVLTWLADNGTIHVIKQALKGELNLGTTIEGFSKGASKEVNKMVTEAVGPDAIRGMLRDAIGLTPLYQIGHINDDGKITAADARLVLRYSVELEQFTDLQMLAAQTNDDGKINAADARNILRHSVELENLPQVEDYKSFTADELLAAAFLKLLTGNKPATKEEAGQVMSLSIYDFLETYAGDVYSKLLLGFINNDAREVLKDIASKDTTGTFAKVINLNYEFKADTFNAYLGAGKGNMVSQLNNAVITLLEVILTPDAFNGLGLEKGGNDKLNLNLTKTFRFILPLIKDVQGLGADLSSFTPEKVAAMSAEDMAVAVLQLFFKGWFRNSDAAEMSKVTNLEQLAVLAAKYTATNTDWISSDISVAAVNKAVNVETLNDEECISLIFDILTELGAKYLQSIKATTYFVLPDDTSAWTGEDYLDEIVDWALNFVKGIPAVADGISMQRGVLDGNGGFWKLNKILNSLVDLSFISGCGNGEFKVDIETMLMDKFLGGLLDFDIESAVSILAENENSTIFNKKINVAVIDFLDDLLTGFFTA